MGLWKDILADMFDSRRGKPKRERLKETQPLKEEPSRSAPIYGFYAKRNAYEEADDFVHLYANLRSYVPDLSRCQDSDMLDNVVSKIMEDIGHLHQNPLNRGVVSPNECVTYIGELLDAERASIEERKAVLTEIIDDIRTHCAISIGICIMDSSPSHHQINGQKRYHQAQEIGFKYLKERGF